MLKLRLFGGIELIDQDNNVLSIGTRKDTALLVFLALQDRPVERSKIAALMWPDRPEEQARKSLRQSLVGLRRRVNRDQMVLCAERNERMSICSSHLRVDALLFSSLVRSGSFEAAVDLYHGPLLEGFSSPSSIFSEWLAIEETRFSDLAIGAFVSLTEQRLAVADWSGAMASARALLEIDPLREAGHQLLMRALDGAGRGTEALQQFHRLSGLLRGELDVRPNVDTVSVYRDIRQKKEMDQASIRSPRLPLTSQERPGLIVLPVKVSGGASADSVIADGLTEELVTALAPYRWFFVISALQASVYRGQTVSAQQLSSELGVSYALTSNLTKAGGRFNVRFQLAETDKGEHLWASRFSCYPDELIEAQDTIAREIAALIEPALIRSEEERLTRKPEVNFETWSKVIRARRLADTCEPRALLQALDLARQASTQSPSSAFAKSVLAYASWLAYLIAQADEAVMNMGIDAAASAIEIDSRYYLGHSSLGSLLFNKGDLDCALTSLRRAIDTNPSFPIAYNQMSSCLTSAGRPNEALQWIAPLNRISPNDPMRGFYGCVRALTWFFLGDDDAAIENAEISLDHHPGWATSELILAAASHRSGQLDKATSSAARFVQANGSMSIEDLRQFFNLKRETDLHSIAQQLNPLGVVSS